MKRFLQTGLLVCLTAVMLTGCELLEFEKFEPAQSGISLDKKGRITEVVIEDFGESYYNQEELKSRIENEINLYNYDYGDKSITKKEILFENQKVNLVMEYASAKDYVQFNNLDFYVGDTAGAIQKGYMFEGTFHPVMDGTVAEEAVWGSSLMRGNDCKVLIADGELLVNIPGTICYVSDGVALSDTATAVIPENTQGYILYKEAEKK